MTETSTTAATESRKRIRIFINDAPYFAPPSPTMTGQQLLALAGLPRWEPALPRRTRVTTRTFRSTQTEPFTAQARA